jgi:predicted DNA-binding protein with PD1-like motif
MSAVRQTGAIYRRSFDQSSPHLEVPDMPDHTPLKFILTPTGKDFVPKSFENVEMASITGSLAWQDGKPSIHVHGVAGRDDFSTVGGHLLALVVGTGSLEITVTRHDRELQRMVEPSIGANVLQL